VLGPLDDAAAFLGTLASDHQAALGERSGGERASRRKRAGAFFTPREIVERLVDLAIGPMLERSTPAELRAMRICDPACGAGEFLIVASERIARAIAAHEPGTRIEDARAHAVRRCVVGIELCPATAELARLLLWSGVRARVSSPDELAANVRAGDGLVEDWRPAGTRAFDAVVGNPPFLNQLESATARPRAMALALESSLRGLAKGYADTSAIFLPRAVEHLREGGRAALIQPQSVLATRDAAPIRAWLTERSRVTDLWVSHERLFDASVRVCAIVVERGEPVAPARVRVRTGRGFVERPACPLPDFETWAPLLAGTMGVPEVAFDNEAGPLALLADVATATADFRDQYYGLRGLLVEDADLGDAERALFPALVTTGLVDPGVCHWGRRGTRFDKQAWASPRVDLIRLERTTRLGPWARSRLRPKLLLATQTPVLEVVGDERGEWLPAVPLISVSLRDPANLWALAALLSSPALSAIAFGMSAGAGLSGDAIKLSAKQVLRLPAPAAGDAERWGVLGRAGEVFRRAGEPGADRRACLIESARLCDAAMGVRDAGVVEAWWLGRAFR
jgi:hypothetical protein